jgi:hypothetical protein
MNVLEILENLAKLSYSSNLLEENIKLLENNVVWQDMCSSQSYYATEDKVVSFE